MQKNVYKTAARLVPTVLKDAKQAEGVAAVLGAADAIGKMVDLRPMFEAIGLDEEQLSQVMAVVEALMTDPDAPEMPEASESADAAMDDAPKADDEMEQKAEEDEDMGKARKQIDVLRKALEAQAEELEVIKTREQVAKTMSAVPGVSTDELATLVVKARAAGLHSLVSTLERCSKAIEASELLRQKASGQDGEEDAPEFGETVIESAKSLAKSAGRSVPSTEDYRQATIQVMRRR